MSLAIKTPERLDVAEVFHALSTEDAAVTAAMRPQIEPFKGAMTGPEAREPFDAIMEQTPDAPGVTYERAVIGGAQGVWSRPRFPALDAAILYLHGGGYVFGSAHAYRHLAGQIAARANAAVFIPGYRLAPEHPFPAAVDDARAAYRGLIEAGARKIALVGDSAGGGLALALLSIARADALSGASDGPLAAVALSPWTDLAATGASITEHADEDPTLTREMLATLAGRYLAGHDPRDPLASPLYGDLAGLPPIQIHTGTSEILLDDTRRYVERARHAGVAATAHIWEGMPHVFPTSAGTLDAAGQALGIIGDFLRETLRSDAE